MPSPTTTQPATQAAIQLPPPAQLHTSQPPTSQAMDPQKPHPVSTDSDVALRGGRSEACPGRFCFCVPCPIPCDFCII